jgi:hypothetical protein
MDGALSISLDGTRICAVPDAAYTPESQRSKLLKLCKALGYTVPLPDNHGCPYTQGFVLQYRPPYYSKP